MTQESNWHIKQSDTENPTHTHWTLWHKESHWHTEQTDTERTPLTVHTLNTVKIPQTVHTLNTVKIPQIVHTLNTVKIPQTVHTLNTVKIPQIVHTLNRATRRENPTDCIGTVQQRWAQGWADGQPAWPGFSVSSVEWRDQPLVEDPAGSSLLATRAERSHAASHLKIKAAGRATQRREEGPATDVFSVPRCCLPPPQVSVFFLFKWGASSVLYGQYTCVCVGGGGGGGACLCACMWLE